MSDDEGHDDSGESEAVRKMEERKQKQIQDAEDYKEYEEQRKLEREKMNAEIQDLRTKKEQRKLERVEQERLMNERRVVEEQKRRAEEDERQQKKREEENQRREAREKKNQEHAKRSQLMGKPNFVISKSDKGPQEEEERPEEKQKSKEQLEAERKAILEQRIQPLNIQGLDKAGLSEKAKELYSLIEKICSDKYDLEQRFKEQNYEMQDLSERARQMNKGGKGKSNMNQDQELDPLADKIAGIPPKVTMYSQYEVVKDRRTFGDRQTLYKGPLYSDGWERIAPEHKIVMTEMGAKNTGEAYDPNEPAAPKPKPAPAAAAPPPKEPTPEPEPETPAVDESADVEVAVEE